MKAGRFFSNIIPAFVLNCILAGASNAGFGFGGENAGGSGLDFNRGYDVNTVTVISGRVVSDPRSGEQEHLMVEVRAGGEIINLSLGPKSFWMERIFPLHPKDNIMVKGSIAQGKDGKCYLMVQKVTNRTTGAQISLRNDWGDPAWSGNSANAMMWNSQGDGMMRGNGMMRR
jgi:hypothetical protein